jgi:prepilin-type N-terminal cleavage/methylation domain-containing protein
MKKWITTNLNGILKCKKGMTLTESLASILIFSILMLTVTTMIVTSLRMTGIYTARAETQQRNANLTVLEKATLDPPQTGTLRITGIGLFTVDVTVNFSQESTFHPPRLGGEL